MSLRDLIDVFPQLIGGLLGFALLLFLISLQQLRVGRMGSYWRQRRVAGTRGGRLFLVSTGIFIFSATAGLFFVLGLVATGRTDLLFGNDDLVGVVLPTSTPQPATGDSVPTSTTTLTPTPVPTRVPQMSHTPTVPPTATDSGTFTAVPTLTGTAPPTRTPSVTPILTSTRTPSTTITPAPTATRSLEAQLGLTPFSAAGHSMPEEAALRIIAADDTVTPNGTPVEPRTMFSSGIERVYFFVSFAGMIDGLNWSPVLLRDGVPLVGETREWTFGAEGSNFFFVDVQGGYLPGQYEARLYVGDDLVNSFNFIIE